MSKLEEELGQHLEEDTNEDDNGNSSSIINKGSPLIANNGGEGNDKVYSSGLSNGDTERGPHLSTISVGKVSSRENGGDSTENGSHFGNKENVNGELEVLERENSEEQLTTM